MTVPSRSQFDEQLTLYEKWYGALEHSLFREVGYSVRKKGFYTYPELRQVAYWKVGSSRNEGRIRRNRKSVVTITKEALRTGLTDRMRVEQLYKLEGVSTPVASALLTVWRPDKYAIIDSVVWGTLKQWIGGNKSHDSVNSYSKLLDFCRARSKSFGQDWTPRRIEQAIFSIGERLD